MLLIYKGLVKNNQCIANIKDERNQDRLYVVVISSNSLECCSAIASCGDEKKEYDTGHMGTY